MNAETAQPWWQAGAIYQVYLRSFQDSDGDGIGDLEGLRSRLDYLERLGVGAIWLSPVHPSPDVDFGYDVADYDGVHPLLGDDAAIDALIEDAHARGLRVILDGVFNHTSDQHAWFQASRAGRGGPLAERYVWRGDDPARPPNNWKSTFGGPAWTWDAGRGQWYLHSFAPQQPDLNWRDPGTAEAVLASMERWFARGIDGFRLDVFNCYLKDPELRDNPRSGHPGGLFYGYIGQAHVHDRDHPDLAAALGRMRALADRFGDRLLVGETLDERFRYENAPQWVGPDRLHAAFHFRLLHSRWGARSFARAIRAWSDALGPDGWPTWVVGNHDFKRAASRWGDPLWGGSRADDRARLVALMLCALRGTPFLYYGDELALRERRMRRAEILDPPGQRFWPFFQGRDGCRTPMPWTDAPGGGFTEGEPWLPLPDDSAARNVAAQESDPGSVLGAWRRALALRRERPALRLGAQIGPDPDHPRLLRWTRARGDERLEIVLNMGGRDEPIDPGEVLLSTRGEASPGVVRGLEGLVIDRS